MTVEKLSIKEVIQEVTESSDYNNSQYLGKKLLKKFQAPN